MELIKSLSAVAWGFALWLIVGFLVSRAGWSSLAASYRADRNFLGKRRRFQSARMGRNGSYNGVLTLGADVNGLWMSVLFLFRFCHPPIYVPWDDVKAERNEGSTFGTRFHFSKTPDVRLALKNEAIRWIEAQKGGIIPRGA